jgi:hypothetical protein
MRCASALLIGWRLVWAASVALCLLGMLVSSTVAAPRAVMWERWQRHNPTDTRTIDHAAWHAWLKRSVVTSHPSGINRVRYAEVTPVDRAIAERYVTALQAVAISTYNRPEQQAYWINLYNAFTVVLVLRHYPVDSIREIRLSSGFFRVGPWRAKLLRIEGEAVSLDDIEHRILRPIWRDSRLHYALNCASLGCPHLLPRAYTAATLETMLDEGARAYVNHERGVTFDHGVLVVSSIYVWFQADFGATRQGLISHLRRYAYEPLATRLRTYQGRMRHRYDWQLNAS